MTDALPGHVTLLIARTVRDDRASAFSAALSVMLQDVARSEGHLGTVVQRPDPPNREWHLLLRFATDADLERWEASAESRRFLDATSDFVIGGPHIERVNGLEAWFALPDRAHTPPPPKWKTAVVSVLAIYPLIMTAQVLLSPIEGYLPGWAATFVSVVALTPIMTWVAMPALTWLMQTWLYGRPKPALRPAMG